MEKIILKIILGLKKIANNIASNAELGRFPLSLVRESSFYLLK